MAKKEPKTFKGIARKIMTGDGRTNPETVIKENFQNFLGEKKKKKR